MHPWGGGGGQKVMYQKWHNKILPVVNFVFSHDGHFGRVGGGGRFWEFFGLFFKLFEMLNAFLNEFLYFFGIQRNSQKLQKKTPKSAPPPPPAFGCSLFQRRPAHDMALPMPLCMSVRRSDCEGGSHRQALSSLSRSAHGAGPSCVSLPLIRRRVPKDTPAGQWQAALRGPGTPPTPPRPHAPHPARDRPALFDSVSAKRAALLTIGCGISTSSILSLAKFAENARSPGKSRFIAFLGVFRLKNLPRPGPAG